MSRAFMKELEDAPEPKTLTAPRSRPMTPAGYRALCARVEREGDPERRNALQAELDAAVPVQPPGDRGLAGFGAHVTVRREDGTEATYTIVGDAEMDAASGKITDASPLGTALVSGRVGDRVTWKRPVGDVPLVITAIRYD